MKVENITYRAPRSPENIKAMESAGIDIPDSDKDRTDDATIVQLGCGFAYQLSVELWG